jgi:hypothetical protein
MNFTKKGRHQDRTGLDEYRISWFEKQFPCIFLDQDLKTCRIYLTKIVNSAYPAMQIISAPIAVSRELKIPADLFPMPLAVVWALYAYNSGVELRKAIKGGTK